jgi:hypothetical protein
VLHLVAWQVPAGGVGPRASDKGHTITCCAAAAGSFREVPRLNSGEAC